MTPARKIKPISYLEAGAAEAVCTITDTGEQRFITQIGEAKIVVQDIHIYVQAQETLTLLKIPAPGEGEVMNGEIPAGEAIEAIRRRLRS